MSNKPMQMAVLAVAVVAVGGLLYGVLQSSKEAPSEPKTEVAATTNTAESAPTPAEEPDQITVPAIPEEVLKEIRYLPEKVSIDAGQGSAVSRMKTMIQGTKRVSNIRPLTNKERDGDFLAPRWSPDGLQLLVSRPGYDGIYILNADGTGLRRIADGNSWTAKWTPDGNIEVMGEDGVLRVYSADGTLISTGAASAFDKPVYAENDAIYLRTEGGGVVPLTTSDDKYFNPTLSPDGKYIVYQGLITGLYIAPADGSGEPTFVGSGNNPVWMPDSSGVVFDVSRDDGHQLTEGNLYFVDAGANERTNMTPNSPNISQNPSVSPSGDSVLFEADGVIYSGDMR